MTLTSPGTSGAYPRRKRLTIWRKWIFDIVTRNEIVEYLAKERRVEAMVENICHHELTADLRDLCQMVYLILLEYDEAKIQDLWENGEINFFIARIIINQYRSSNSPFYSLYRKFQDRSVSIGVGSDITDEAIQYINRNFKPWKER